MAKKSETLRDEINRLVKKRLAEFWTWLKPDKKDGIILQFLKLILKIPVFILALALSPVVLVILLIIFIGTF